MADVKMSLQEYNDLHERMLKLQRIVDLLITPVVDEKEFNSYQVHGGSYQVRSQFSTDDPAIKELVQEKSAEVFENAIVVNRGYNESVSLGYIYFPSRTTCLICGEELENNRVCSGKAYCKEHCSSCEDYDNGNCWTYKRHIEKEQNKEG
jgi:hypothetical protein